MKARSRPRAHDVAARALAVVVCLGDPAGAAAAGPAIDELTGRIEELLASANRATELGDHLTAAERFAEAFELLPERREHHDARALALLDSVRARRRAFEALHDPQQLCTARQLVARYLAEAAAAYGIAAATMDGPTSAARERQEVDAALEAAQETCPSDQPKVEPAPPVESGPEPPPAAPPPGRSSLKIAGAVSLGIGGGLLVMMAIGLGVGQGAEAAGRNARRADPTRDIDALLDEGFVGRGRVGNGLAVAGGLIGGVAAVLGAGLLIGGSRSRTAGGAVGLRVGPSPLGVWLRF